MKLMPLVAMAAFLAAPSLLRAQAADAQNSKATQELMDFRNKYIQAEEDRDGAYLEKVLADDFYALNPQGQLLNKSQQIANLLRPERTLKITPPTEVQVHFHGDTAILWERITVIGTDKGKPYGGDFRFSRVFVKEHGEWKVVLAQGAPISPPSPSK